MNDEHEKLIYELRLRVYELERELHEANERGIGYSQQTVDAITAERERLRSDADVLRQRVVGLELEFHREMRLKDEAHRRAVDAERKLVAGLALLGEYRLGRSDMPGYAALMRALTQ